MWIGYPTLVLNIAGFVLPYSGGTAPAFTGFSPPPLSRQWAFQGTKTICANLDIEMRFVNFARSHFFTFTYHFVKKWARKKTTLHKINSSNFHSFNLEANSKTR